MYFVRSSMTSFLYCMLHSITSETSIMPEPTIFLLRFFNSSESSLLLIISNFSLSFMFQFSFHFFKFSTFAKSKKVKLLFMLSTDAASIKSCLLTSFTFDKIFMEFAFIKQDEDKMYISSPFFLNTRNHILNICLCQDF